MVSAAGFEPATHALKGGGRLCGPQCSGLLLGRKGSDRGGPAEFESARRSHVPALEVGKEEVISCLTALATWLSLDEKRLCAEWNGRVDRIRKLVETVPGAS